MPRKTRSRLAGEVLFSSLPGPTRRREPSPYCYRLTYRNPQQLSCGCVLQWDVMGGREIYQVALERDERGAYRWHCTCADAAYRGETRTRHCKHVRGLQAHGREAPKAAV